MLVLYGSQTGNAQDVAELLASEATERGIDSCALPMDCVTLDEMGREAAVVFVCSTTGALPWVPLSQRCQRANCTVRVLGRGESATIESG